MVTISEFWSFYLPVEHDELLTQDGVFRYQIFAAARDIRRGTHSENGRYWFGELFDGFFDLMEERFSGSDKSRKYDELNSILVN
jgi:hypothetical protein